MNKLRGNVFQAIVSVMAVKIQFNSPSIVLRSFNSPGICSMRLYVTLGKSFAVFCRENHLRAVLIGVVRQDVNKSAGNFGFIGNN